MSSVVTTNNRSYIDTYDCVLDKIIGDVAHITLKTTAGNTFVGKYSASELNEYGVYENRRFKLHHVVEGEKTSINIKLIPDAKISLEHQKEIDDRLSAIFGDDNAPQDDY